MKFLYKSAILLFTILFISSCGGNADILKVGNSAPDFTLQDASGKTYTLSSYKNISPVVVYFYPKANTPGCTTEACGIRDDFSKFKQNNIVVLGVSVDSKDAIKEFIDDYHLNFPLLSDKNKKVSEEYGTLNNFGFSNRVTFIINKSGKIARIIKDVNVDTHANTVFKIASELN